jgi:hypothetical protein
LKLISKSDTLVDIYKIQRHMPYLAVVKHLKLGIKKMTESLTV